MKFIRNIFKRDYKRSYAQAGEDVLADFILRALKIRKPTYLDVGAHDPVKFSNTYYFYKNGCKGVNVEPDPELFAKFGFKRRRDVNLNVGVAAKAGVIDFYVIPGGTTLSTCSRETMERYKSIGSGEPKVLKINVVPINGIIEKYFDKCPNLVTIDVEGLEVEILESFDFKKYRPEVFCIETVYYNENRKNDEIFKVMERNGYIVCGDTFVNTVFVDKKRWAERPTIIKNNPGE
ncbi:MAG: FkbM family methyltransferase [Deltaproteobacteria bacterium]|nr:FkbM family methyltransferase [Deltaproteobacteria bacterium]